MFSNSLFTCHDVFKIIYIYQDPSTSRKFKNVKIHIYDEILENVVNATLYKKCALNWKFYCLDDCKCLGVTDSMNQCHGCKNWYHTDCICEYKDGKWDQYARKKRK